ncbi:MAG: TraR/DksA C4-type zinc finger protein [Eubacteriales bacterium]
MKTEKLNYYENKLMNEKKRVKELIEEMKENDMIDLHEEMESELSLYDNHPGDIGTIRADMERAIAFKGNEVSILKKIEDALHVMKQGDYGVCQRCGKIIPEERLEVIPYTTLCLSCEKQIH